MTLNEIMSTNLVQIDPMESAAVAARALARYNVGALPVCDAGGRLRGIVTDRDLVVRCLALETSPANTRVEEVMTSRVVSAPPDMDAAEAAALMGRRQIRRLPVVQDGQLRGMVSLSDLAGVEAERALGAISKNIANF
ncbi:MAG: CBS domain-containing protein [Firmicutes bacterium]|nr:CBS domain-containing protein [Bacillota bacterium]